MKYILALVGLAIGLLVGYTGAGIFGDGKPVVGVEAQLANAQAELERIRQENASIRTEGDEQVKFLTDEVIRLRALGEESSDEMIGDLSEQLANLESENANLTKMVSDIKAEADAAKAQAFQASQNASDVAAQATAAKANEMIAALNAENQNLRNQLATVQNGAATGAETSAAQQRLAELEAQNVTLQNQLTDLESKANAALQSVGADANAKLAELSNKYNALAMQYDSVTQQLNNAKAQFNGVVQSLGSTGIDVNGLLQQSGVQNLIQSLTAPQQ